MEYSRLKVHDLVDGLGAAVREMDTEAGPADYVLFIDAKAYGIIETKCEGTELDPAFSQSGIMPILLTRK